MATVAAAERRRIERDLHDGAQQHLTAVRIELGLLAERVGEEQAWLRAELDRLRRELDGALDELRELAHGLYPQLLASDGLHTALSAVARRAPGTVEVLGREVGRLAPEVENAAYFCCVEALQNVAKHAGEGARTTVRLAVRDGVLELQVADDGVGFEPAAMPEGQGLRNLRDRLGALGGQAQIAASPGAGTVVAGQIPLR